MSQIGRKVRQAIVAQLSPSATGFNDRLASVAGTYGIDAYTIDWTSESQNFIYGRIAPQLLDESSPLTYPLVTIDTVRSQNTNRVKFALFAGPVTALIEVHHSWTQDSALQDFSDLVDATEDAMIAALNDQEHQ